MPSSPSESRRRVLAITGCTRSASTNTALCRTATPCAPDGATVTVFDGLTALPHFYPDDDHEPLPPAVAGLRAAIAEADAVLINTPEHAGTLPGSMKNLLEWTVGSTVLIGRPTARVNGATGPGRGVGAVAALATVLGDVQADVVDARARVPVVREDVGADGLNTHPPTLAAITRVLTTLLASTRREAACASSEVEDLAELPATTVHVVEHQVPDVVG